jgi:hypothetical protein
MKKQGVCFIVSSLIRMTTLVRSSKSMIVMFPKLVLANLLGLLAITPVKPTCGQMGNLPSKHYQS